MIQNTRSIKKPVLLLGAAFVFGMLVWTGTAAGQSRDDVRSELEKTDVLIQHARDLVTEAGSVPGREVVQNAERTQQRAWDHFRRGQMRPARQLTLRAREELYRALGNLRQDESNDREVERQLEKTDELLRQIHDRIRDRGHGGPPHQLQAVTNLQRRAWDLYRERRLRPALRLTLQARDTAAKLIENARRRGGPGMPGDPDLGIRLDRLSDAIDNAGERLRGTDSEQAQRHWEEASAALARAREALDAGDERRAQRQLNQARRALDRAMDFLRQDVRGDEVETLIEAARDRWNQLGSQVSDSSNDRLERMYEQAGRRLAEAERMLDENRPRRALVQVRRAIELMDRINGQLKP